MAETVLPFGTGFKLKGLLRQKTDHFTGGTTSLRCIKGPPERFGAKVIIEGPDKAGKSTLIEAMVNTQDWCKANVIHFSAPSKNFDFNGIYRIHLESDVDQIFDRCFISELIYSYVLGRKTRLRNVNSLMKSLIENNVVVCIMVAADEEQKELLLNRVATSKEDSNLGEYIIDLNDRYVEVAKYLKSINVNVKLVDMNLREIQLEV